MSVKVSKNGTLHDVVQAILSFGLAGLNGVYVGGESTSESADHDSNDATVKGRKSAELNKQKKLARKTATVTSLGSTTTSHDGNNNGNSTTPYYFQAGELVNHRIKSFNTLERPINNIRDSDCVVLFQVREMYGIASAHNSNNNVESSEPRSGEKADVDKDVDVDVEAATLHNTLVNAGKRVTKHRLPPPILQANSGTAQNTNNVFDPESLYKANYSDRDQWVSILYVIVQKLWSIMFMYLGIALLLLHWYLYSYSNL